MRNLYGVEFSGWCLCRHRAEDHEMGIHACESFGSADRAGLNGRGQPHCTRYTDAEDPDPFRIALWHASFGPAASSCPPERVIKQLRAAFNALSTGSARERYRPTLRALERARAA